MSYITEDCCRQLVHMGHSCHTKLVKCTLETKPNTDPAKVLAEGEEIFGTCDKETKPADL